jgi:hypothetical protein
LDLKICTNGKLAGDVINTALSGMCLTLLIFNNRLDRNFSPKHNQPIQQNRRQNPPPASGQETASSVPRSGATPTMIPIRIQCGCGQRYAFDVETAGSLKPETVTCPICGADGTGTANAAIARHVSGQPAVASAPVGRSRIRVASSSPPVHLAISSASPSTVSLRPTTPRARQIDHTQAQHEAKAKIFWGDPPMRSSNF